ncbi:MAG: malate dehydrogenase [Gammaproteobacteria bacterium]|nr:malate dehydrogenase [Gammaproteobacteria bacterium]
MSDFLRRAALEYHEKPRPGKIATQITKPTETQRDLALAYSPGVGQPCKEIQKNPDNAYRYTSKGNLIGVITDGTAVLGLGNIGPLAGKPVMEGKGVLFKRFADIDVFDIEVDAETTEDFIETVVRIARTFGGINLEDIAAPRCFEIEQALVERLDIPVFHDDQHGTAIVVAAGLMNALDIQGKRLPDVKICVAGSGAAAIATITVLIELGATPDNILISGRKGILYKGREDIDRWRAPYAIETRARTIADACVGADVFIGVSGPDILTPDMLNTMAPNPVIFALANPDPEIMPDLAHQTRSDIIMATGRSDFPNQINNVLCFPYLFRGALDVNASRITPEMRVAAVHAIAELAKEEVPVEVLTAYNDDTLSFGKNYIIPTPFDPRLIERVPPAVSKAAVESGTARSFTIENDEV